MFDFFKPKTIGLITDSVEVFEAGKSIKITEKYRFHSITIQSNSKNVGAIFIGGAGVNMTNSVILEPGDAMSIDVGKDFIDDIYVNSNKSGSRIQFFGTGELI